MSDLYEVPPQGNRGLESVCAECLDDDALRAWLEQAGRKGRCSYCGRATATTRVVNFANLVEKVLQGLLLEWEDSVEENPWDEGYVFPGLMTDELWYQIDDPFANDDLRVDVSTALGDYFWVQRDLFGLPKDRALTYAWEAFKARVLHERRYFFLTSDISQETLVGAGEVAPEKILDQIGEAVIEQDLVTELGPGIRFRKGRMTRGKYLSSARELGPPPKERALTSNRMSPA